MNFSKTYFLLISFAFICELFASPLGQTVVSPHIVRGFTRTLSVNYTAVPYKVGFNYSYYHSAGYMENGGENVYITENTFPLIVCPGGFFNIGSKKFEIGFYYWGITPFFYANVSRIRVNFNIVDKGNNGKLFDNYAISLFSGGAISWLSHIHTYQSYFGFSLGTQIKRDVDFTFELFTSPSLNYINYRYDNLYTMPFNAISDSRTTPYVHGKIGNTIELDLPIAGRVLFRELKRFYFTLGLVPSVILRTDFQYKKKHISDNNVIFPVYTDYGINRNKAINDVKINSLFHISVFAEIGINFGARRYNQELRKQKEQREQLIKGDNL